MPLLSSYNFTREIKKQQVGPDDLYVPHLYIALIVKQKITPLKVLILAWDEAYYNVTVSSLDVSLTNP